MVFFITIIAITTHSLPPSSFPYLLSAAFLTWYDGIVDDFSGFKVTRVCGWTARNIRVFL